MKSLVDRLNVVRKKIREAAKSSGRQLNEIELIAVSKTQHYSHIIEATEAGQMSFGENYLQEALPKIEEINRILPDLPDLSFHYIGRIQRNKIKKIVGNFDLIHTVDRVEVLEELSKVCCSKGVSQKILLQVNISEESSKAGISPSEIVELAKTCISTPGVELQGLMSIGSTKNDVATLREFKLMKELSDGLIELYGDRVSRLSMGMSHDFEEAIKWGANYIRVGSSIFGTRQNSPGNLVSNSIP